MPYQATILPLSNSYMDTIALFTKAVMRFKKGEFPPFPDGTRMAIVQAEAVAEVMTKVGG